MHKLRVSVLQEVRIMAEPINHVIGHARTIRTAIMCVEYLRARHFTNLHADMFTFRFTDPTPANGFWSGEIIVRCYRELDIAESHELVEVCRAFVAGAGEVWT